MIRLFCLFVLIPFCGTACNTKGRSEGGQKRTAQELAHDTGTKELTRKDALKKVLENENIEEQAIMVGRLRVLAADAYAARVQCSSGSEWLAKQPKDKRVDLWGRNVYVQCYPGEEPVFCSKGPVETKLGSICWSDAYRRTPVK